VVERRAELLFLQPQRVDSVASVHGLAADCGELRARVCHLLVHLLNLSNEAFKGLGIRMPGDKAVELLPLFLEGGDRAFGPGPRLRRGRMLRRGIGERPRGLLKRLFLGGERCRWTASWPLLDRVEADRARVANDEGRSDRVGAVLTLCVLQPVSGRLKGVVGSLPFLVEALFVVQRPLKRLARVGEALAASQKFSMSGERRLERAKWRPLLGGLLELHECGLSLLEVLLSAAAFFGRRLKAVGQRGDLGWHAHGGKPRGEVMGGCRCGVEGFDRGVESPQAGARPVYLRSQVLEPGQPGFCLLLRRIGRVGKRLQALLAETRCGIGLGGSLSGLTRHPSIAAKIQELDEEFLPVGGPVVQELCELALGQDDAFGEVLEGQAEQLLDGLVDLSGAAGSGLGGLGVDVSLEPRLPGRRAALGGAADDSGGDVPLAADLEDEGDARLQGLDGDGEPDATLILVPRDVAIEGKAHRVDEARLA
jgi:hypothetical protein